MTVAPASREIPSVAPAMRAERTIPGRSQAIPFRPAVESARSLAICAIMTA